MKIDLYGKTAIVTGSTDGIGFAIARGLALCGATVVINGRKPAGVDRAVAALRAAVPEAELRSVATDSRPPPVAGPWWRPSPHVTSSSTMSASMAHRISSTFPTASGRGFSSLM